MTEEELIEAFKAATLEEEKARTNAHFLSKEIEIKSEELNKIKQEWENIYYHKLGHLTESAKIAMQLQDLWLQENK